MEQLIVTKEFNIPEDKVLFEVNEKGVLIGVIKRINPIVGQFNFFTISGCCDCEDTDFSLEELAQRILNRNHSIMYQSADGKWLKADSTTNKVVFKDSGKEFNKDYLNDGVIVAKDKANTIFGSVYCRGDKFEIVYDDGVISFSASSLSGLMETYNVTTFWYAK